MLACCMKPSSSDEVPPATPPPAPSEPGEPKPVTLSFRELQIATRGWRTDCFLGKGGTCEVFRGMLKNKQMVAIKRLRKDPAMNGLRHPKWLLGCWRYHAWYIRLPVAVEEGYHV
ncbi:hypothetical protein L6452_45005 [Arctium lappa]|nr:hypothetical protein L6452_45005 [Arctium lappa]